MSSERSPLETLGGYDLLEKIGDGSMGSVYKARHWQTKQIVAIKVLSPEIARNPVLLKRFEQEFRITGRLHHPNIVRVVEYSGTLPNPHLVMEFIEGEPLGQKLEREGRMSEDAAIRIIVQAGNGLERAHREGLIHRDIKPDNIMVMPDGTAKVIDLGLAKTTEGGIGLTRAGTGMGTPNFMSPEQFRNAKNVDARCDVYSLAATLYQMVTGELPFGSSDPIQIFSRKLRNELPSPRSLVPSLSERVDRAIWRGLSVEASQRPASCREFIEELLGRGNAPSEEQWHVIFTDAQGQVGSTTSTSQELRRALAAGRLGNVQDVKVSRSKGGPYELLTHFAEFRDLAATPFPEMPLRASLPSPAIETTPMPVRESPKRPHIPWPSSSHQPEHASWQWLTLLLFLMALAAILLAAVRCFFPAS